jgi:hypothetical protein
VVEKRGEEIVLDERAGAGAEIKPRRLCQYTGMPTRSAPAMSSGEPATKSVRAASRPNAWSASR